MRVDAELSRSGKVKGGEAGREPIQCVYSHEWDRITMVNCISDDVRNGGDIETIAMHR